MHLVEVDVVRLEPREALVDRLDDVGARKRRLPVAVSKPVALTAADDLRGKDHARAGALPRGEPGADDLLRAPLRFALGRDGIHLGGVEQVHAAVDREVHLLVALRFGVLLAPGHGAERQRAHLEPGVAERAVLHPSLQCEAARPDGHTVSTPWGAPVGSALPSTG